MEIPYLKDSEGNIILNADGKATIDLESLDRITKIKNIVISSYHAIANGELENIYSEGKNNLNSFDYIVADECHFLLKDTDFNNKCYLVFKQLLKTVHHHAIKIFISATIEEIIGAINKSSENSNKDGFHEDYKLHTYSTGNDYSYLNTKYFKKKENVLQLIKNDNTNDKWLIFVTSKKIGNEIVEELEKEKIPVSLVKAGVKNDEIKNIIDEQKFNKKVLVSTKAMDNGINIKDEDLKHIVIMANDKVTFIQELGRVRFDINNAPMINLYIPTLYKKTFLTKITHMLEPKFKMTQEHQENINEFKRKYNYNYNKLPIDIFNINEKGKWDINILGYTRLMRDLSFCREMVEKFKSDDFAFIKEQLRWLGLEDTFNMDNLIEDMVDNKEVNMLESFLENCLGKKILKDEQQELSDLIINKLTTIGNNIDKRSKKIHPKTLNSILEHDLKLPYNITSTKTSKRIQGGGNKKYTYWTIIKTIEKQ